MPFVYETPNIYRISPCNTAPHKLTKYGDFMAARLPSDRLQTNLVR